MTDPFMQGYLDGKRRQYANKRLNRLSNKLANSHTGTGVDPTTRVKAIASTQGAIKRWERELTRLAGGP